MDMIPRTEYLDWIDEFRDKPLVKVLTGLRRSGKSTILDMFMSRFEHLGEVPVEFLSVVHEFLLVPFRRKKFYHVAVRNR